MNAFLTIWLLFSSVSAHDYEQGWQRPNGRSPPVPANAQYYPAFHSTTPPLEHEYTKYSSPLNWTQEYELWEQRQSGTPEAQVSRHIMNEHMMIPFIELSVSVCNSTRHERVHHVRLTVPSGHSRRSGLRLSGSLPQRSATERSAR
jgi:hypothetical protein